MTCDWTTHTIGTGGLSPACPVTGWLLPPHGNPTTGRTIADNVSLPDDRRDKTEIEVVP